jgi:hypothetical protein
MHMLAIRRAQGHTVGIVAQLTYGSICSRLQGTETCFSRLFSIHETFIAIQRLSASFVLIIMLQTSRRRPSGVAAKLGKQQ